MSIPVNKKYINYSDEQKKWQLRRFAVWYLYCRAYVNATSDNAIATFDNGIALTYNAIASADNAIVSTCNAIVLADNAIVSTCNAIVLADNAIVSSFYLQTTVDLLQKSLNHPSPTPFKGRCLKIRHWRE